MNGGEGGVLTNRFFIFLIPPTQVSTAPDLAFSHRLRLVAGYAERLKVLGIVCAALRDVDDLVDL